MKVLGVGNALVDVLVRLESDTYLEKMGLPKGSMQLIDEDGLMRILEAIRDYDTFLATGGSAANAICGLAKMGIEAGFIGKICDDYYGNFYKKDLQKNGVKTFLTVDTITSGCAMAMISPDGERTFGTYLGAAANLNIRDLSPEMFLGYDYFFIEGYLVQSPEFIRRAIKMAKQANLKVVLDLASYNIVNANHAFFTELLQYTDIVFANEEESYAYTGCEPAESAKKLGEICPIAVVKIGPKGSYIAHNGSVIHATATKAKCIDSTGAGDLYAAGFLYGLSKNAPLITCGEIGSLISGHVIECIGTKMSEKVWTSIKKDIALLLNTDYIR